MNHIEVAISVLKDEIYKLNSNLKYGHHLPADEEEITERLQKLNRAVNDIQNKLNTKNKFSNMTDEIWKQTNEQTKMNRS